MGTNYLCGECGEEFTSDEILPIKRCPECLSDMITEDDGRDVNKCTTKADEEGY